MGFALILLGICAVPVAILLLSWHEWSGKRSAEGWMRRWRERRSLRGAGLTQETGEPQEFLCGSCQGIILVARPESAQAVKTVLRSMEGLARNAGRPTLVCDDCYASMVVDGRAVLELPNVNPDPRNFRIATPWPRCTPVRPPEDVQ